MQSVFFAFFYFTLPDISAVSLLSRTTRAGVVNVFQQVQEARKGNLPEFCFEYILYQGPVSDISLSSVYYSERDLV